MNVKMLHSLTRFSRPRTRLVVSPPRCRTFCSKPIPSLLRPPARESSAKFGGILLAYPDLRLEVDGHTDSTGSGEYNQQLSEKRAASVRDYLVQHGIPISSVAVMGFGKTAAVASNSTASGRQQNRRVELVVSGEVIGTPIGWQLQTTEQPAGLDQGASSAATLRPPSHGSGEPNAGRVGS